MASSFRIPGNIKQQMLPFVLQPGSGINKTAETTSDLQGFNDPQYFTFRNNWKYMMSGKGKLGIIPQTYEDNIKFDIANKLLYTPDKTSITINDLFDNIPGVQIREFLPDAKLDQCLNFVSTLIAKCKECFFTKKEDSNNNVVENLPKNDTSFMKKLMGTIWYAIKYITGNTDPSFFTNLDGLKRVTMEGYPGQSDLKTYILNFPYIMYYRLQSCTTTNIYEVPLAVDNKNLYGSSGAEGWLGGVLGFTKDIEQLNKIPLLGGMLNSIIQSVQITYTKWWDNSTGRAVHEPEIKVSFDLFNDTLEHALINFIFVNTIVPNNRWIQYNMFQHASNLYDIKIEGVYRMYMCTGKFDVQQKGILRNPSDKFLETLTSKYLNPKYSGLTANSIKLQHLIKIPDVYHIDATFNSILPANFNTFIFNYAQNNNHIDTYYTEVYDPSALAELVPQAIENFGTQVNKCWQNGGKDPGQTKVSDIDAKILGG